MPSTLSYSSLAIRKGIQPARISFQ